MFNVNFDFGFDQQQMQSLQNMQPPLQAQWQSPDDFAAQYASSNGISLEDAKTELKSKYGDPAPMGMGNDSIFKYDRNFGCKPQDRIFSQEDMNEFLELQNLVFSQRNQNNFRLPQLNFAHDIGSENIISPFINPETNTMTGPQKEGDPHFDSNFFNIRREYD